VEQKRIDILAKNLSRFPQPRDLGRIHSVFNEPIYHIMTEIKNKTFFSWPTPLGGDPSKRDPNKYCSYYREKGHMT
jgi:hypothetical protein